ncbi:hypothetical protein Tco_0802900 [Tanacetum coccineum]|uniref:Uncharacterized protein n=1 Tax=Tanacetum coccineum TaxID=301880 RepID=A0ABQ5A3Q4_9ASTR
MAGLTLLGLGRRSHMVDLSHYALNATIIICVLVCAHILSLRQVPTRRSRAIWLVTIGVLHNANALLLTTKRASGGGHCPGLPPTRTVEISDDLIPGCSDNGFIREPSFLHQLGEAPGTLVFGAKKKVMEYFRYVHSTTPRILKS